MEKALVTMRTAAFEMLYTLTRAPAEAVDRSDVDNFSISLLLHNPGHRLAGEVEAFQIQVHDRFPEAFVGIQDGSHGRAGAGIVDQNVNLSELLRDGANHFWISSVFPK